MKLILTRDVANLGAPGDIVEVKSGYGRNYLVPQGMAIAWSKGAQAQIAQIRRAREVREIRGKDHAQELKNELEGLNIAVTARAGETGQLFGRVTEKELAQAIKKAGGPGIDRHRIEVGDPIKHVGDHEVVVSLHHDVAAKLTVSVSAAE